MPLNKALIGRSVSQELVPVSRENVVAFARALGFEDPVYSDVDEARIADHPDVVAPPTYAVALSAATAHLILDDPGDLTTRKLAELGADVVKFEALPNGDYLRANPPFHDGRSIKHLLLNRGKCSVVGDVRTPEGRALLDRLVPHVD